MGSRPLVGGMNCKAKARGQQGRDKNVRAEDPRTWNPGFTHHMTLTRATDPLRLFPQLQNNSDVTYLTEL